MSDILDDLMGDEEPRKVGRPTLFKPEYLEQVYKLCLLGAKDTQIAEFFGIAESTLNLWKEVHPEFMESIKKGKELADMEIVNSLYHRAKGMTIKSEKAIKVKCGKDQEEIETVEVSETLPPDPVSMFFWLKNRQPEMWRDKKEVDHTTKGESLHDLKGKSTEELLKRAEAVRKLSDNE